jgi:RecA-family ATPase
VAKTFSGTLDDVWPQVLLLNTPQRRVGVFVTVSETDLKGRKAENVVRTRALIADADSNEAVDQCEKTFATVPPSMIVNTGRGRHYYFLLHDLPLDKFRILQEQLNTKLGTDPAVKDLPRVLRLAGTLHLKDLTNPRPITLHNQQGEPVHRYRLADLVAKLGLSLDAVSEQKPADVGSQLFVDPAMANQGPSAFFKGMKIEPLSEGLKDYWFDKLTPEQKDACVYYILSMIAANTELLELSDNGGNNNDYFKLITALAISDAPHVEDYFVEFASKVENADSEETLHAEFRRCQKAADGRITVGTLLKYAYDAGADLSQWRGQTEAKPAQVFPLPFINISNWDNEPLPEREWAVPKRIPLRQTALLSGEGKGKSYVTLHLCVAHVLGRDWLNSMPTMGPAIFIDAEDDETELHIRLSSILKHYDATYTDAVKCGLHLLSFVGRDAVLATAGRYNSKIEPTPLYEQLLQAAGDIKPKMIGIASVASVFAGNENDRTQVQQFTSLLTRIARVANGSVQLISHPSLTGMNSDSGLSGSTQWHNAVRARAYLKGIKAEDDQQPDSDLRELVFKKVQYGPDVDSVILRYQHGMFLLEPRVFSLDKAKQMEVAKEVFLTLLDRFTKANRAVRDQQGRSYAPAVFAAEEETKKAVLNKQMLKNAMLQLYHDQKIWNEPCGPPSRRSYRIARGMNPQLKKKAS